MPHRSWVRAASITVAVLVAMSASTLSQAAASEAAGRLPVRETPSRVEEMLRWLAREQYRDGGWTYRVRLTLRYHLHNQPPSADYAKNSERVWPSNVADTATAGMSLIRAGYRPGLGRYGPNVQRAAEYLYRAVMSSAPETLAIAPQTTAFTARVGPHVDTFLALLFFAELRRAMADDPEFRYGPAMRKLINKIERNQRKDGSWDDEDVGAGHAPLLGHALGVWALESATRSGARIDANVVHRAAKYAMSKEAEQREWKRNGKWKFRKIGKRPKWLFNAGVDDDDPVNHELYVMAARLSVLDQTDRTNRWRIEQETARLEAKRGGPTKREVERLRSFATSAKGTQRTLAEARAFIRKTWTRVHKNDVSPSPAPVLFTAEDFLSCLLIVNAMGNQPDVEQWYLHVVQRLMHFQDMDGGIRTNQHIMCAHPRIDGDCQPPWPSFPELPVPMQFCIWHRFWGSRDRTFITSASLMILAAETPYRNAVLGLDPGSPGAVMLERRK